MNTTHLVLGCFVYLISVAILPAREKSLEAEMSKAPGHDPESEAPIAAVTGEPKIPDGELPAMVVSVDPYIPLRSNVEQTKWQMYLGFTAMNFGWPSLYGDFVLTPGRFAQRPVRVPVWVKVATGDEIRAEPRISYDHVLQSARPFRYGTSDAGLRALQDAIPLNDPYNGRVPWNIIPREALTRVEIVPGGGAMAWGDGTTGSVMQVFTRPPTGKRVMEPQRSVKTGPEGQSRMREMVRGTGMFSVRLGEFSTRQVEFVEEQPTRHGVVQILGRAFTTNGFPRFQSEDQGPIDRPASHHHAWLQAKWRRMLAPNFEVMMSVRHFDETRNQGTHDQMSRDRRTSASVHIASNRTSGFSWNALAYADRSAHSSRVSAASDDRSSEYPAIDRIGVPAVAFGGAWTGAWWHGNVHRTVAGIDARIERGETRDRVGYVGNAFTRETIAGGTYGDFGGFFSHHRALTPGVNAMVGMRLGSWWEARGHQRETSLLTSNVLRNDHLRGTVHTNLIPSAGLV